MKKKLEVKMSNQTWENDPSSWDFEVIDCRGNVILEGTQHIDVDFAEEDEDEDEDEDGFVQSGDFTIGHTSYNMLETQVVVIRDIYVSYFPHAALKTVAKYFKDGLRYIKLPSY